MRGHGSKDILFVPSDSIVQQGGRVVVGDPSTTTEAGPTAFSRAVSMALQPAANHPPSLGLTEEERLELMHYFTTKTSLSMSAGPLYQSIWRDTIPPHAFRFGFLLDALLAFTLLHRHINQEGDQTDLDILRAQDCFQSCLESYIPSLQSIDHDTYIAVFPCSNVLVGISFALLRHRPLLDEQDGILSGLTQTFELLLGAETIASGVRTLIQEGSLAPLLDTELAYPHDPYEPAPGLLETLSTILSKSQATATACGVMEAARVSTAYQSSIDSLKRCVSKVSSYSILAVGAWPSRAGRTYLELLKQRDSWAMVILAYYGVLLHQHQRYWFIGDSGRRLVQAIAESLGEEWFWYIHWAKESTSIGNNGQSIR